MCLSREDMYNIYVHCFSIPYSDITLEIAQEHKIPVDPWFVGV